MIQWLTIDMHIQTLKSRFTIHEGNFESNLKIAKATGETWNNMKSDVRIVVWINETQKINIFYKDKFAQFC
jgi:hypothetical protein